MVTNIISIWQEEELEAKKGWVTYSRSFGEWWCEPCLNQNSLALEPVLPLPHVFTWPPSTSHGCFERRSQRRTLLPFYWWVSWALETVSWCGQAHSNSKEQSWSWLSLFKAMFCLWVARIMRMMWKPGIKWLTVCQVMSWFLYSYLILSSVFWEVCTIIIPISQVRIVTSRVIFSRSHG